MERKSARQTADEYVVSCAADLFLRKGIGAVKMVDIADAAGMGVATLYRHFSTKTRIAVSAATMLWKRINARLVDLVESSRFMELNGIGRMRALLEAYCDVYITHSDFVAFLDEFDHLVVTGQLDRQELEGYGAQVDSFYLIFEDAYLLGRQDGSIVRDVAFRPFYIALAHALMGVAQKLRRGEIIPSDDFSGGREELHNIVNMALWSLATDVSVPEVPVAVDLEG